MSYTIVCTGGRDYRGESQVGLFLDLLLDHHGKDLRVRVGDCPTGLDAFVRAWCMRALSPGTWRVYNADWERHGNAAGPIRNEEMFEDGLSPTDHSAVDLCVAWPGGKGTADCVLRAGDWDVDVLFVGGRKT